jgi:polysaccharide chain length determinant protein (PEP-CTERM system associated)
MLGHRQLRPEDYLAILRRRKWLILVPVLLGPVVGYLTSKMVQTRYTSQTVVLIDQPKVPDSFVKPVVTDEMNQRLMTMQEQILSRSRLLPIIDRYGLAQGRTDATSIDDIVAGLRKSIIITPTRPLEGTESRGVLGFSISYTGNDAQQTQAICNDITSMFIQENLQHREQRAEGTTEFLQKQLGDAKHTLDDQDAKLAGFKRRYIDQLPDQVQTNMSLLQSTNTQLEAATQAIGRAQQDKAFTQSLLAQQVAAWKSSLADSNPQTLETQLANMRAQLVTLEARYTPDHPDVIKMKSDIEQMKQKLDEANAAAKAQAGVADTRAALAEPAQIQQLRAQLHQYDQTIQDKTREQERLQGQIRTYEARIHMSPLVEQEYKEITRDYTNAQAFYNDLLTKKNQSEMASDLERRQEGEQFRVLDPANLPDRPVFPDRRLFAATGMGLGFLLGIGLSVLLEMRDKALRTEQDVELFLELPTLALVPSVGRSNGRKNALITRGEGKETLFVHRNQA